MHEPTLKDLGMILHFVMRQHRLKAAIDPVCQLAPFAEGSRAEKLLQVGN